VADAVVPGQTIIVASANYVGCTRDLLVEPLERRGLRVHRDVHVGFCPALDRGTASGETSAPVVVAAPRCAAVEAAIAARVGFIRFVGSIEEAEACALAGPALPRRGAMVKRALDVAVAGIGLVLLLPLLAVVALAILLDDGRPVLFTQERIGMNGRRFRFRKFRTMIDGAERRLDDVVKLNQIRGPAFQIDDDPRLTRTGGFLRRSSLDELPQLWNVLRGEMSLVGPRPAPIVEVAAYSPWHRRRLTVKPGITGLAQVRARKYRDFDQRATLDLDYIDQWSISLDFAILLQTIAVAMRLTGR
jgi:lipopolysaccharide/colanic/teichoic acid biosynthesis glycosyltransferase